MHPLFQIVCSRKHEHRLLVSLMLLCWMWQTEGACFEHMIQLCNWQMDWHLHPTFECQLSTQGSLLQVSFTQSHTIIQCVSVPKCFLTVVHTLTFQSTHWGKSEFCAQGCFNRRSPGLIHWPSNWLVICSSTWATAAHREPKVSQKQLWLDFCLLAHFSIVHCY